MNMNMNTKYKIQIELNEIDIVRDFDLFDCMN